MDNGETDALPCYIHFSAYLLIMDLDGRIREKIRPLKRDATEGFKIFRTRTASLIRMLKAHSR